MSNIIFRSKHLNTISYTEQGFSDLLDKEWDNLECHMSDSSVILIPRHKILSLWLKKKMCGVRNSPIKLAVLTVR
jgi:hypothetical protein